MAFELGVYHFGELTPDPTTGAMMNPGVHLRHLVEQQPLPIRLDSMSSASASTIAPTSQSQPLPLCSRQWLRLPTTSSCPAP